MRWAGSNSGGDDAEPVDAGPYCGHVLENRNEVLIVYLFDDMDELIGFDIQCSHGMQATNVPLKLRQECHTHIMPRTTDIRMKIHTTCG